MSGRPPEVTAAERSPKNVRMLHLSALRSFFDGLPHVRVDAATARGLPLLRVSSVTQGRTVEIACDFIGDAWQYTRRDDGSVIGPVTAPEKAVRALLDLFASA
jgi:hypothetical protein